LDELSGRSASGRKASTGCEKQATTKTVKRRGTDESKQIKRDEEDFSGG